MLTGEKYCKGEGKGKQGRERNKGRNTTREESIYKKNMGIEKVVKKVVKKKWLQMKRQRKRKEKKEDYYIH